MKQPSPEVTKFPRARRNTTADRLPRIAVTGLFFVHGLLFASWAAHIPEVKQQLGLGVGGLGVALLAAPIGSVLATSAAAFLLPRFGSRAVVRVALAGYCATGPLIGLSGSSVTFFVAFMAWGAFQGALDVAMNTQAISVERRSSRPLMPGFHGTWSIGSLAGAALGASGVAIGMSLSTQLLLLGSSSLFAIGWLTTSLVPDKRSEGDLTLSDRGRGRSGILQAAVLVLAMIALADMLCEGAAADWAAVYLRDSLHTAPAIAALGYTAYSLSMVVVRLSGNRLLNCFDRSRLLPFLAGIATLGFGAGLLIDRPASVLVGFAFLGAGLASIIPTIFSAAGDVPHVHAGTAIAVVSACGWVGFVCGPPLIGELASATSLRTALIVLPVLTGLIAVATARTTALRTVERECAHRPTTGSSVPL